MRRSLKSPKKQTIKGRQGVKKLEWAPRQWCPCKENNAKECEKLPNLSHTRWSRRQKQRYACRQLKKEREFYQRKCKEEKKTYQERVRQIVREIERDTLSRYGFIPDLGLSTFKNVYNIIVNMPCSYYFSRPNNLAFHDLTKIKSVPLVAREILGLSTKFISTKPFTSSATDLEKSQDNFRRDAHLKVFFADSPIENDPPKLYVKSKWRPPLDEIPQEVDTIICNFFREINRMFKRKPAISNLLPSQQKLLLWLKNHVTWLVANTDKNLGPCVIKICTHILTRRSGSWFISKTPQRMRL